MIDTRVQAICDEYEIRIVPANVIPKIGETRAPNTLARIIAKHGEDHCRFVVGTLADTANNKAMLDEIAYWTVSDMVRACRKNFPAMMENDVGSWYDFFDSIPLGRLQYWCLGLEGVTSKRRALVGMVWERAVRRFGSLGQQPDLLDDRANNYSPFKGAA